MQKYQNNVTSRTGDAVSGLQVTVTVSGGGLATIFSDNAGTPLDNPLTTDANGYFEFYAADGRYNITAGGGGYTDVLIADTVQIAVAASEAASIAQGAATTAVDAKDGAEEARDEAVPAAETASEQAVISTTKASESTASAVAAALSESLSATNAAASLAAGNKYTTTAQGIAATTSGQLFLLKTADPQVWDVYTNSAGTAVFFAPMSVGSALDTANSKYQFVFAAAKNLYNPALAEDGFIYDFTTGAKGAFANGIASGKVPVTEGVTYIFSQPSTERGFIGNVHCYSGVAGATYVGMAAALSGAPVIPGMNLIVGPNGAGATGGKQSVSFLIPVGSGITHVAMSMLFNYVAHTTADFNRIRNSVQFELGTTATSFQPYSISKGVLKDDSLPSMSVKVNSAFTIEAQRNLYNKANAVDGQLIAFDTGLNSAFPNGMSLGYTPVEAGKTYVAWMGDALGFNSAHPIYCRNAAGTFLGIDHTIGATPGMASPPTGITWIGNSQVTLTIPPGSLIASIGFMAEYSTHNTADFQRVIGSVQVEETARTAYQPYSPGGLPVLNENSLPAEDAATQTGTGPMSITKSGNALYVRGSFDDTYDILQLVQLANGSNSTVNVMGARKALKTVTDDATAWGTGTILGTQGDSSAPIQINGTYIGANHGAFIVQQVTANAHGKTVVDVGSEWTDGVARKWYLMQVIDVNTLWFVSENLSVYPAWSFATAISGATLTHSSGATHTGAVTVSAAVTTQLWPSLQAQTATVAIDSNVQITADGTYRATVVDVVNTYNIANPAAVVTYVRSQVGGATQPSFIHASIAADVKRTLTYRYAENGSCEIVDGIQMLTAQTLNYFGSTQAEALEYTGKQLWQYIPRVTPKVGGVKTWDFQAQENIGGTFEQLNLASANWTDANNPPDRLAQIVKTAGVAEYGLMVGYSPVRSVGVPALRKTLVTEACFLSALRKQYPKAVNVGPLPAGSYYEIAAFRAYWSATLNPAATACVWYRDGKSVIVVADFHQNVTLSPLKLPQQLVGLDVTVVDKTASATVHGNGVVTAGGVLVSITGGYGYVVLKLS